ncbi:intraflagellar transport protein 22 homolog [Elysia marginata]|uniref:Intraflagellar transport protein 22 homolog n=1 Tax=Elysia marginata TaxID=1093978 RepID=A0AAV4HYA0_9GAST|nr:intraflagellar transport protein 22 homolog [Elysia marginata]
MSKAKVIVVGPCEAGKTVLCNFLADATEFSGGEYHPTQGVRIVEFETNGPDNSRSALDVELWDCSGHRRFESCWPAMIRDASGAIFVYNPDVPNHDKELDTWYNFIIGNQHLKDNQCYVYAHHRPNTAGQSTELSNSFSKIPLVHTNLEEDADAVRSEFTRFLWTLVRAMSSNREQEELNIMNQ